MSNKQQVVTALAFNKKGKLIAIGRNSYTKTHTLQSRYAKKAGRPKAIYLHAELHCLIKSREPVHRLVVMRYNSDGLPVNSKPCSICQLAIKDFNVKHISHT